MTRSVLILEDSPIQARIICKLFERAGLTPAHAATHTEAMQLLKVQSFALLVLDVYVSGANTLDHLDDIRDLAPDAPIAIMTAGRREDPLAASNALNKARRAKVEFLLPKPFHYDDIVQICQDALRLNNERPESDLGPSVAVML